MPWERNRILSGSSETMLCTSPTLTQHTLGAYRSSYICLPLALAQGLRLTDSTRRGLQV